MNKEKIQLIFLIVLIVGGVSFSYINYLLLPNLEVIENKENEVRSKEADYINLMTYSANPNILNKQIVDQYQELAKISNLMPNSLDKPLITYNIYATLKRNNLIGDNLVFDVPEHYGTYEVMNLSLSVSGIPLDVFRAIDELQKSSDALAFRSANFTAQEGALKAEIQLQAFALQGSKERTDKPPFMNVPLGVDSLTDLFSKNEI